MPGIWIAEIRFHPAVDAKIRSKHNVTPEQVREAVALGAADTVTWHTDLVYGRRLIATGRDHGGREIDVYLRPADRDQEIWDCLTAIPTEA
jgi:hypothetical protein